MGIGDSIGKAAENAMEDLAGTSEPTDDAHAPEPGAKDEDIQVHSSISEGSNAMDDDDTSPGTGTRRTAHTPQETGTGASGGAGASEAAGSIAEVGAEGGTGTGTDTQDAGGSGAAEGSGAPGHVAGSAGLPDPDPDELRADPSEADQDPTTGRGRS
ncbi:hypothetical protein [Arthrobacter sp. D1-17]